MQDPNAGVVHHRERTTDSPDDVRQLAALMPADLAAAVSLAAWCGFGYGELFALARRHVDVTSESIHVERALVNLSSEPIVFGPPRTTRNSRTVHLPGSVEPRRHVQEYISADPDALSFPRGCLVYLGSANSLLLGPVTYSLRSAEHVVSLASRAEITWVRCTGQCQRSNVRSI